jgi:hypothetical protein
MPPLRVDVTANKLHDMNIEKADPGMEEIEIKGREEDEQAIKGERLSNNFILILVMLIASCKLADCRSRSSLGNRRRVQLASWRQKSCGMVPSEHNNSYEHWDSFEDI